MKATGLSGKQIAVLNLQRFEAWVEERKRVGDWRLYVRGNKLNRSEIAVECGFAKSVLQQNPSVLSLLGEVERDLVKEGVLLATTSADAQLGPESTSLAQEGDTRATQAALGRAMAAKARAEQRAKGLEEQNAVLRAEARELRERLKQYQLIEEHLALTGRLLTP